MAMREPQKFAIVTGAARGNGNGIGIDVGRAICLKLAAHGVSVAVNYPFAADREQANAIVRDVEALGQRGLAVRADVTHHDDIARLFAEAIDAFGAIDIVVSNAGGDRVIKPIADVTEEEYDLITALNGKAHFFVLQQAALHVRPAGRIVYIASNSSAMPDAGCAVYAGAKAAGGIYAKVLAKEIGARGITVNAVCPVPVEHAHASGHTAPRHAGTSESIADAVGFLVSEKARWLTGQTIRVNGGPDS